MLPLLALCCLQAHSVWDAETWVTARVDERALGGGTLPAGTAGMAALESGWHETEFDAFSMEPAEGDGERLVARVAP